MEYGNTVNGTFISRPNRFIANVEVDGRIEKVHVKNTGRCAEILIPGCTVILEESANPSRKTRYDLVAAYKGKMLINIDSQAPNTAFKQWIKSSGYFGKDVIVHPEYTHGDSRFDFYIESGERRILVEVKGVTQEHEGVCMFPDAPTDRGLKHLRGLDSAREEGFETYVALIVQMKGMRLFKPNFETHEEFGTELERVVRRGTGLLVLDCIVTESSMTVDSTIPYDLSHS